MKPVILICSIFLIACVNPLFAQPAKGWVTLSGTTRNFNNQVEVEDMSEMQDLLLPDPQHFFVPDSSGHFSIKFSLNSPNYFRVGRNILYLSPGDDLVVFIDYKDPKLATFAGTHSKENEYLRGTPFPKGGSFLEAGDNIKATIALTVGAVSVAANDRLKSLGEYTGLSKEFVKLEIGRIRADQLNSIADIGVYFPYVHKLSKDSTALFQKNFAEESAPYLDQYNKDFIDPSLLKLVVYRDIVNKLIAKEKNNTPQVQQVKEWMAARDMAQQIKKASDRETKMGFESKIKTIRNTVYREALANTLSKVLQLSNGDLAADFNAADQNNKTLHLADLKGKLIYVDIWATWCGPCLEEMPAYEKLKETYKDNPAISFVSLSIDDDKDAWRKNMNKRNAQGLQ